MNIKRKIKAVIAKYVDSEKKTHTKKVFFSTDTGMNTIDIFDIYQMCLAILERVSVL